MDATLRGSVVSMRPAADADVAELAQIRATPEVYQRWGGGDDLVAAVRDDLSDVDTHHLVIIAAIRSYTKVGFREVGIMRRYERGPDGTWHDGLLMDLLPEDLTER